MTGQSVPRLAAVCLLILSVFMGPAGLGGALSFAMYLECGDECPCDEAALDRDQAGSDGDSSTHSRRSSDDECPQDCSDCGCCVHAAHAVLATLAGLKTAAPPNESEVSMAMSPPHSGVHDGVFRPPRSLT